MVIYKNLYSFQDSYSKKSWIDQKTGNSFKLWVYPYPMHDYFEIDRLIEDLAKIYSTECVTTCFKLSKTELPTTAKL
jgi:hypothetical protein